MRRKFSTVFAIAMVMAMLLAAVIPAAAAPVSAPTFDQSPTFTAVTDVTPLRSGVVVEPKDAVGPATYIVQLADAPLATYQGTVAGFAATSRTSDIAAANVRRLNTDPLSRTYL